MIEGSVNAYYEAVVTLPIEGTPGQMREVDAVVDTGFNGYLTLPPMLVRELGLPVVGDAEAVLADGSEATFDVYGITVLWDGQLRYVETGAVGGEPSRRDVHARQSQPLRRSQGRRACSH